MNLDSYDVGALYCFALAVIGTPAIVIVAALRGRK